MEWSCCSPVTFSLTLIVFPYVDLALSDSFEQVSLEPTLFKGRLGKGRLGRGWNRLLGSLQSDAALRTTLELPKSPVNLKVGRHTKT